MSATAVTQNATPTTVLTGFLGSGKTTILNRLLERPALSNTAVLINEFGEVGIDHLLVRRLDENTVMLNSGCICCTVRGDLVRALRDLYAKRLREEIPSFDRVLIETTGLADPAPIAHTFFSDLFVSSCFRLDAIVTTVDAVHAPSQIESQSESVKQIAIADRLVVTKQDLVSTDAVEALLAQIRRLNPTAPIETARYGEVEPERILDIGLFSADRRVQVEQWLRHDGHEHQDEHAGTGHRHLSDITSFCATFDRPLSWPKLTRALETIVSRHGPDILRVKGLFNVQGEKTPIVMHGVQHLFHPPVRLPEWPSEDRRSRVVFITRKAVAAQIQRVLNEEITGGSAGARLETSLSVRPA